MKLIYRIALRLSLFLVPLMALWATLFYFTMVDEINEEADDALDDYSERMPIPTHISNTTMPKYIFPKKRKPNRLVSSLSFFKIMTKTTTS